MCVGVRFCVLYSFWSGRSESVAGPSDIATTPTLSGVDDFCRKLLQIASVSVSPFDVSRYGTGYVCVPGTGTTVQDTKKNENICPA